MRVYVTGASGFVGGHVARELREQGHEVVDGWVDLLDATGLRRAVAGCHAVVHVAALYSFTAPEHELQAVNVEGTRNVVDACSAEGVDRLLATSSCATCGPVPGRQATEEDAPPTWELAVPYERRSSRRSGWCSRPAACASIRPRPWATATARRHRRVRWSAASQPGATAPTPGSA